MPIGLAGWAYRQRTLPSAVEQAVKQFGKLTILVNNAGGGGPKPFDMPMGDFERAFQLNLFSVFRMSQLCAPHMKAAGGGAIINISSIAGKLSTPVNGTYSATKFALEALSDALRLELAPFGIQVMVIEPGAIKTHFDDTAQAHAQDILSNSASPYQPLYQKSDQFAASMRQQEHGPQVVSQVIQQAIEAPNPKARYLAAVALSGRLVLVLRDFVWNPVLRRLFKVK